MEQKVVLTKVQSTNIEAYGYDDQTSTLYISFHGGRVYRYKDVPKLVWESIQKVTSKGSFFREWIDGNFEYEKVNDQTLFTGGNS